MQTFVVFLSAAILVLAAAHHDGSSPCVEQFEYEPQHKALGRWEGTFKLKTDYTLHGIWLRMILDRPAKSVKVLEPSGFEVLEGDDKKSEYLIKNRDYLLKKNTLVELKVLVEFDTEEAKDKEEPKVSVAPRLLSYRINGRVVCPVGAE